MNKTLQILLTQLDKSGVQGDITTIDLRDAVTYTDYFLICSCKNRKRVRELIHELQNLLPDQNMRIERDPENNWVVLDAGDVIVHIFTPQARTFYRLEKLWGGFPQNHYQPSPAWAV